MSSNTIVIDCVYALKCVLKDLSFTRYVRWYLGKRASREGIAFLTRVLPALSKHVLSCIEQGQWVPFPFQELGVSPLPTKGPERYTAIIADELHCIFSRTSNTSDRALNLWRIRQLCEYFYKLSLPFSDEAIDDASQKFLATDLSLDYDRDFADEVRSVAETVLKSAVKLQLHDVARYARFGPGTFSGMNDVAGDNLQAKKDNLRSICFSHQKPFAGFVRPRKTSLEHYSMHLRLSVPPGWNVRCLEPNDYLPLFLIFRSD